MERLGFVGERLSGKKITYRSPGQLAEHFECVCVAQLENPGELMEGGEREMRLKLRVLGEKP